MIKKIAMLLVLMLLLTGCQLAQEEKLEETGADMGDKMIGVFITEEYLSLFDMEGYIQDHLKDVLDDEVLSGNTSAYEGRIYAKQVEVAHDGITTVDFIFEGLEGIRFFAPTVHQEDPLQDYGTLISDDGVSDVHRGVHVKDGGEELALTATVYAAEGKGRYAYYMNPVFQDEEGNVYLMAGTGIESDAFGSMTQKEASEVTYTEDGVATTYSCSVEVTFETVPVPDNIVILQMDGQSEILSREVHTPGQVPREITPVAGAEYLIVETHNADGTVSRELYGQDEDYIETFCAAENDLCVEKSAEILWSEE